jgi:uncharacterized delta-60 repeat protein
LATVLVLAAVAGASATPGQLDPSFGVHGIGGGELGPHYAESRFEAVAEEPDGSLLATRDGTVRRYLANGTLDPGFAPQNSELPPAEATQADGKRLVAQDSGQEGKIRRLNPDGTPDTSFNGGTSEPTASYWVRIIVPLPSGQILVAGTADRLLGRSGLEYRTGLSRLNADGTLDRGFGDHGSVYLLNEDVGYVSGLVPQQDGSVLVIGSSAAFRLTAAGKLDPGYRAGGRAGQAVIGFRALPGGAIALAGTIEGVDGEGARDFFVAHYGPGGELDPSFAGGRGFATADFGGVDVARSVLWNEDGSVLVGGSTTSSDSACVALRECGQAPALARFDAAGNLDPGFGSDGLLRIEQLAGPVRPFGQGGVTAMAARRDGGVVAAGAAAPEASVAFLAAIAADGTLERNFGSAGVVREENPQPSYQGGGPMAIANDGKILVGGQTTAGPGETAALLRFSPIGKIDSGYGAEPGFARLSAIEFVIAVAVERSGAAVVLGRGGKLVRVTAGGLIDSSFGAGGVVALDRPRDHFEALAVLPGGKILLAGTRHWHGRRSRMLVARLLRSGSPDPSFGKGGFAVVGCRRQGRCGANRIAVQPDGRILLAGRVQKTGATASYFAKPSRLAVARVLPRGTPDRGFGDAGLTTLRAGYYSTATTLALTGRKILVAGWSSSAGSPHEALLLRYLPNGTLDHGFGERGIASRSGAGDPSAVLPTSKRIVILTKHGPRPALTFRYDGTSDTAFAPPLLGRKHKIASGFEGALQGSRAVVAWTEVKGPNPSSPTLVQLARLRNR